MNLVLAAISTIGRGIAGGIRLVRRRLRLLDEERHPDDATLRAEQIVQSREYQSPADGEATGR